VAANREASQRAELGAVPDVVATVPFLETDVFDLSGLAAVGEVVAGESTDEPGRGWSDRQDAGDRDDEILGDVPPHHG